MKELKKIVVVVVVVVVIYLFIIRSRLILTLTLTYIPCATEHRRSEKKLLIYIN